jgi:hypothetical protein
MADRVDKQWKDKGIQSYSTPAIIGTLNHYGVSVDEAALKAAGDTTPLELAGQWKASWKGTGQFATFPYAAANELLARLFPDRPTPMKLATVLVELIAASTRYLSKPPESPETGPGTPVGAAFAAWDAVAMGLPPEGPRRDAFVGEVVAFLEPWAKPFGELPQAYAQVGDGEAARRFALVHEQLFPDRRGCATAVVRSELGEHEQAVADLTAWAGDTARDVFARYAAIDALFQLESWEGIKAQGLSVFDLAAEQAKWTPADSTAHLLAQACEVTEVTPAFAAEVERRLERAHAATGGHGHHH